MSSTASLQDVCTQVRRDIVRMVHGASSGHPGGSLGCTDFLVKLYFEEMQIDPENFTMDGRGEDLFFLSNGHISPVWYSVLSRRGYFPVSELATFRKLNTRLQGHPATEEGPAGHPRGQWLPRTRAERGLRCSPSQEAEWRGPLGLQPPRRRRTAGRPDLGSGDVRCPPQARQPDQLRGLQWTADRWCRGRRDVARRPRRQVGRFRLDRPRVQRARPRRPRPHLQGSPRRSRTKVDRLSS